MLSTSILRLLLTRSVKPFAFRGGAGKPQSLAGLAGAELGLYIHIPFCRSLCSFCPYCKELFHPQTAAAYKRALLQEIDLWGAVLSEGYPVSSLYVGGGTPALMAADLKEIFGRLRRYCSLPEKIAVELHPADITAAVLEELSAAGVTMVSLGLQSFDDGCCSVLGRSSAGFADKMNLVQRQGFAVVDVDLIFAIPGQTPSGLCRDVDTAFAHGATQVSTYPFIDFTFASNRQKPLPSRVKKAMLSELARHCAARGWQRTAVWTFARPGTDKYSSVTRDAFVGFGTSAVTLLTDTFAINTFSSDAYIQRLAAGLLPTALTAVLSRRQRAAYHLFWAAYTTKVDCEVSAVLGGRSLAQIFRWELAWAQAAGLVCRQGRHYRLTERGILLYHSLEQNYTRAYIDVLWNALRREAFPETLLLS